MQEEAVLVWRMAFCEKIEALCADSFRCINKYNEMSVG